MPARRSAAAKALAGTARRDRLPKPTDPAAKLAEAPPPPDHLSGRARSEWMGLAPAAVGLGTLTGADLRALELLCEALAAEAEARAAGAREGLSVATAGGGRKPHPAVRIAEAARNQAHRLLSDFGLTPRGRQGVDATPPPDPDDPAEAYFATERFR